MGRPRAECELLHRLASLAKKTGIALQTSLLFKIQASKETMMTVPSSLLLDSFDMNALYRH
jgi:hypothetical protein